MNGFAPVRQTEINKAVAVLLATGQTSFAYKGILSRYLLNVKKTVVRGRSFWGSGGSEKFTGDYIAHWINFL